MPNFAVIFLAFLTVLVALQANALQFRLPIRKDAHTAKSLSRIVGAIRGGTHKNLKSLQNPLKPIKFLDTQLPGDYFVAEISIGTPPQPFTVEVDTSAQFLCVLNQSYPNATKYEHKYNPRDSKTSVYDGMDFINNYQSGFMSGETYRDVFTMGDYTYKNQSFGAINEIQDGFGVYPVDGVLGLAWSTKFSRDHLPSWDPPVDHINEQMDKHVFSVFMNKYVVGQVNTGQITFGAYDEKNCGDFKFVPLKEYEPYILRSFTVDSFAIGEKYWKRYTKVHAIYATGKAVTLIPYQDFMAVIDHLKPVYDFKTALYTIPCKEIPQKPDLIWTIGGTKRAVTSSYYIVDIGNKDGNCVMAVDAFPEWLYKDGLLLGDAFAQTFCAAFDVAGEQIGFGEAKHN